MEFLGHHPLLGFIPNLGPFEIGVLLFVGLLLFAHRIPSAARSLGQGLVAFKQGLKESDGP